MSMKAFVNNTNLFESFKEYIEGEVAKRRQTLETVTDPIQLYQAQGQLKELRNMLKLKEIINAK